MTEAFDDEVEVKLFEIKKKKVNDGTEEIIMEGE